jgi:hypothetical protein
MKVFALHRFNLPLFDSRLPKNNMAQTPRPILDIFIPTLHVELSLSLESSDNPTNISLVIFSVLVFSIAS